ncbi:MAG: mannosyl transferase [Mucilaginibacter sp.]|nr:mannosyl transferase [Mucilaginibacter sp.]
MNIVFFTHPAFLQYRSMDSFSNMLYTAMEKKGHKVEVWSPVSVFSSLPVGKFIKKWLGYIDQYLVFTRTVRLRLKKCSPDTLFVFTDQALGPWVSLVINKPHVIHCHDFLALQSAIGEIPEHHTSWSGRIYQSFIRKGYSRSTNFISVSKKTKEQLHKFLPKTAVCSEVVYNGLKETFKAGESLIARELLKNITGINLMEGYILHVGGNQWYKNRVGVIEIYNAWRSKSKLELPLLLIGDYPSPQLVKTHSQSPFKYDIHFLVEKSDEFINKAYAGASVFLFPSLAEGFGWPIAEAMMCGCPVITTNEAPMTEVGGNAGFFIPRRPNNNINVQNWANGAAELVNDIIGFSWQKRQKVVDLGITNAKRFNAINALDHIESIYINILQHNNSHENIARC